MFKNHNTSNPKFVFQKNVSYRYVPVQETLKTDELGTYVTYGISVRTVEEEIAFVSDVSTVYEEIERLADMCTAKQLDPVHLGEVVQDFLANPEEELALS